MSEADILAATYEDSCSVYRPISVVVDGKTTFKKGREGQQVYASIPCALSSAAGGDLVQTPSVASVPTKYTLFTRPEVDIQPNDWLEVDQRGKRYELLAGLPDRFSSHNEVPLLLRKDKA